MAFSVILRLVTFYAFLRCAAVNGNGHVAGYDRGPCDALKLPSDHDRYRVPSTDKRPILLSVWVTLQRIVDIDERNGLVVAEAEFGVQWRDGTLAHLSPSFAQAGEQRDGKILNCIWKPDLFFEEVEGASESSLLNDLSTVQLSRAERGGVDIKCRSRKTLRLRCNMDFEYYPADLQLCTYHIRSYSYTRDLLYLQYDSVGKPINVVVKDHSSYDLILANVAPSPGTTLIVGQQYGGDDSKNFSVLTFTLLARRKLGSHMAMTYIPSLLLVMVTWLCFLLPGSMVEARISVCMTTLLTLTAMFASVRQNAPYVNYYTAMDVWMFFCIIKVFTALIAFTVSHWVNRRRGEGFQGGESPVVDSKTWVALERQMHRWGFAIFAIVFSTFLFLYWAWILLASSYLSFHDGQSLPTVDQNPAYLTEPWRVPTNVELPKDMVPGHLPFGLDELCPEGYGLSLRWKDKGFEIACDLAHFNGMCRLGSPETVAINGSEIPTCKLTWGAVLICRESYLSRTFELSCPPGMICDLNTDLCECPNGEGHQGRNEPCTKESFFQEPCHDTLWCVQGLPGEHTMLFCGANNGVCICPTGTRWNAGTQKCISTVGHICMDNVNCPNHSYCREDNICAENHARKYPKPDDGCAREIEVGLDAANDGLTCRHGRYTCGLMHQHYDWHRLRCASGYGTNCGSDASCGVTMECRNATCVCRNGTMSHPGSWDKDQVPCLPTHGSYCFIHPVQDGTRSLGNCNMYAGLECRFHECACVERTLIFDSGLRRCVSPVGGYCGKRLNDYFEVGCSKGAECKSVEGTGLGVCVLKNDDVNAL